MVSVVFFEFDGEGQNLVICAALFFFLAKPHQVHQTDVVAAFLAATLVDYLEHVEGADIVLFQVGLLEGQ